jgi:hypothetical protein
MAKFMAVHPLPAPATIAELTPVAKLAKANSTVDAYWVGAWSQLNEEGKIVKILCQWNAPNIEEVRKVVAKLPCPTEGVYPSMMVDAEDFR